MNLIDAARAAEILGARWENDPLRLFRPSPRQSMFLESTKAEVALLGANRCGKSISLAALIASTVRFGNLNPRFAYSSGGRLAIADRAMAVWVVGLTERLVKEGIQPKVVRTSYTASETHPAFIPATEIEGSNINDQMWRLKNGSIVGFKSSDSSRDVFQSAARDLIAFDEICDYDVYKEATFRVPGANRRLYIRLAATLLPPLGMAGGVSWYFPEKIKPWWAGGNKENTPDGQNPHPSLDIFTMGMRDNPHIHPDELRRLEDMFPPGSVDRRIRIDGELVQSIGGTPAYSAFTYSVHVDKRITPDARDQRYPLALCVDFNVAPCIWVIGQYIEGTWYFFDEIVMEHANIPGMVDAFRQRYPHHGAPIFVYGDASGVHRNVQTGESHYWMLQEAFRSYPVPVQLKLPTVNPLVIDRLNAVNRKFSGADGRVGILFGPLCRESIADCEEVQRDMRGGIKKTSDLSNPYTQRTHAMDCVGYAICATDPVPRFTTYSENRLRHIPSPGYLGRGGRVGFGGPAAPPPGYLDGRLRYGRSGGIIPPRKP